VANVCDIEVTGWDVIPFVLTAMGIPLWSGFRHSCAPVVMETTVLPKPARRHISTDRTIAGTVTRTS
jgi:hypothetical protein